MFQKTFRRYKKLLNFLFVIILDPMIWHESESLIPSSAAPNQEDLPPRGKFSSFNLSRGTTAVRRDELYSSYVGPIPRG